METITPGQALLPATRNQKALLEQLVQSFPQSKELSEYADYLENPNRGNASAFLAMAMEQNLELIVHRGNYMEYIAKRPRVQQMGSHGLFTGTQESLVLSQVAEIVATHPGNVWLPIISLRREDAARLGYDNAENWKALLSSYAVDMAEAMKIPFEDFRWYAAFHNESHHPHIHMVCYSINPAKGFLTKDGIAQIKAGLAKQIFRQELTALYKRQTQHRDMLTQNAGSLLEALIEKMQTGTLENNRIEQLMEHLAHRLRFVSGKKQYGYLKAPLKSVVDEIVDELAREPCVAEAYRQWFELRKNILSTYCNDTPVCPPLSQQKEFKRLKNLVIEEAIRLEEYISVFPQEPPDSNISSQETDDQTAWERFEKFARLGNPYAQYQLGKLLFQGDAMPRDVTKATYWLTQAAEQGNPHAQYTLGKIYLLGKDVPKDRDTAVRWFTLPASQGNEYAKYFLDHMDEHPSAPLFQSATRLLHHLGNIFREQTPPPSSGGLRVAVDRKLLQKIRAKKAAQGHKADDHEPSMTL